MQITKDAKRIHIMVTHFPESEPYKPTGERIEIPWVPTDYSRKGDAVLKEGFWFPVLVLDADRSNPCRMPIRLMDQRLPEQKQRMAAERKELDKFAILEAKRKHLAGMHIHG